MSFVAFVEEFEEDDTAEVDTCDVDGEGVLLGGGFPEMDLESCDVI